jgi:hypothetical protein
MRNSKVFLTMLLIVITSIEAFSQNGIFQETTQVGTLKTSSKAAGTDTTLVEAWKNTKGGGMGLSLKTTADSCVWELNGTYNSFKSSKPMLFQDHTYISSTDFISTSSFNDTSQAEVRISSDYFGMGFPAVSFNTGNLEGDTTGVDEVMGITVFDGRVNSSYLGMNIGYINNVTGYINRFSFANNAFNWDMNPKDGVDSMRITGTKLGMLFTSDGSITVPTSTVDIRGSLRVTDGTQGAGKVFTDVTGSGTGTWQDHTAYGEMGFGDSLRTLALTQNVWSVVTNIAKNLLSEGAISLHNVTYQADSLTIDSSGTYQLFGNLSVAGTNPSIMKFGIFKNGVLMCTCTQLMGLENNEVIGLSYNDIAPLVSGDVLQLVLMNTANNDDADLISGKITISKIR